MGEPNGKPLPEPAKKTVLIVEDDILIRMTVADDLMGAGFEVVQAASAAEALKVLNSAVTLHLLMTDIRMPGEIDGLGLAALARAEWPSLKVVVLSGDLPDGPPNAFADAFLAKPYDFGVVLALINQLLGSATDGHH